MFRGRYPGTVDAKGRLSIPAKFRDVLARYEGRDLVAVPDGECLDAYPLPEWEPVPLETFAVAHGDQVSRTEKHTSELHSHPQFVCRLLLLKKTKNMNT